MTPDEAVDDFAHRHGIARSAALAEEGETIACAVACHLAIGEGYTALPASVLEKDMAVGLLWQLFDRCTERIEGAIIAMVVASPAVSEIVARASMEACATFRYILLDRRRHVASFLGNHIREAERQERQWRSAANNLGTQERAVHTAACDYRGQGIAAIKGVVRQLISELIGSDEAPPWPPISERFAAIGDAIGYRTLYARLCAEPHLDAEETLRDFIGKTTDSEVRQALAAETMAFSRLMLSEATSRYAIAGQSYAELYGMSRAVTVCREAERTMMQQSRHLSGYVGGVPRAG